jgi:hypothetical protein
MGREVKYGQNILTRKPTRDREHRKFRLILDDIITVDITHRKRLQIGQN